MYSFRISKIKDIIAIQKIRISLRRYTKFNWYKKWKEKINSSDFFNKSDDLYGTNENILTNCIEREVPKAIFQIPRENNMTDDT